MDMDDHNATPTQISVSGHLRFGLTNPEVAALVRDLPNSDKAQLLFPPMSPSKRKYHYISDDSADDTYKSKSHRFESSLPIREDMVDLESAIATLQALKHCSVY